MFLKTQNIHTGLESPIIILNNINLRRAINSLKVLSDDCDFYGTKFEGGWNKSGPLMASFPGGDLIGPGPPPSDLPSVFLQLCKTDALFHLPVISKSSRLCNWRPVSFLGYGVRKPPLPNTSHLSLYHSINSECK